MDSIPPSSSPRTWDPALRVAAKYTLFVGVLFYLRWAIKQYLDFDGLFEIGRDRAVGGDFINYWTAARLTLAHHMTTLFNPDAYLAAQQALMHHRLADFNHWGYPPSFIPMILWLGLFPYPVALGLWLLTTFALYALTVARGRPMPWNVVLMLVLAPVTYANMDVGQNGFLSAAFLVGGLRLLDRRPTLAGILFGLLSFKPQLGLLVPIGLIAARRGRAFLVATLTIATLIGISVALFGIDPWIDYLHVNIPYQQTVLQSDAHADTLHMMVTPFISMRILGAGLAPAYAVNFLTAILAAAAVIYAFRRSPSAELRNAVLLTATFLTSPYLYFYDMTCLGAGIVGTAAAAPSPVGARFLLMLLAGWLLPALVFPLNQAAVIPIAPVIVLLLLGTQLRMIARRRKESAA